MTDLNQIDSAVQSGAAKVSGVAIGPTGAQQLSPEEAKAALDAAAQAAEQQRMLVISLMKRLQAKCDDVVKAKRPIEYRMVDDIRQYDGNTRIRASKTDTTSVSAGREAPVIHATRSRCDALESRLSDMLFPNNDHAWDMACTPDDEWESPDPKDPDTQTYGVLPPNGPPQAPQGAPPQPPQAAQAPQQPPQPGQPQGQPGAPQGQPQAPPQPSPADIKQQYDEKCEAACQRMKKVIQDQLSECKFTSAGRRMVRDGCRYGYGVVGGPFNTIKVQRRFRGPNMEMTVKEVPIPSIQYCDPWRFFPDMVPVMDKAEFVFYLNLMSGREVQELADNPGFNKEEIIKLLKEEPDLGEVKVNINYRNEHLDLIEPTTGRYGVWRYTGALDRKDLDALANMFPDLQGDMDTHLTGDNADLQVIPMVDMWYSQNHPLKVRIRPIEKDFRVPYYVFSPFPADDTVFGYGIPYLTRDSARVVNAAWAMTLHNGSVSAGPIILERSGKVEPRDRSWEFRGPKVMSVTDPDITLDDAMKVINVENNAQEALTILDRALQILDDEAMTPQVLQGDATQSVPTSSGLAMLFNAASIVMRRAASCFDDEVGLPVMQRMYWWNMLYNDRQDIKGDYDIKPLGQAKMLVKDVQIQHLQAFMQQSMNPQLAPFINLPEALKLWTNLLELPTDKVLNDIATVQQQMQSQPNPAQDLANAKVQQTLAQAHELTTRAQANAVKAQAGAQGNPGVDPAEIQMHQEDLAVRREEAQASVAAKTLELQAEMAKLHQLHDSTVQNNVTKIHLGHVKAGTDMHNKAMSVQIEAAKLAHAQKQGQQKQ